MKVLEPYHFVMVELVSSLENIDVVSLKRRPQGMRCRRDVSFRSHIGRDVADHAGSSSWRRNWYVNETNLFETSFWRLIGTYTKPTNLRLRNDVPIDT